MMNFSEVKTTQEIIRISGKRYPYPTIPTDRNPHFKTPPLRNAQVLS